MRYQEDVVHLFFRRNTSLEKFVYEHGPKFYLALAAYVMYVDAFGFLGRISAVLLAIVSFAILGMRWSFRKQFKQYL